MPFSLHAYNFLIQYMTKWKSFFEGGEFRGMDISLLRQEDSKPFWHDGETTQGLHHMPLRNRPWKNRFISLNWKKLAEQKGLLKDIPVEQLYELNGFWCAISPETHIACYSQAIDFLVPVGTDILASSSGEIIELVENNTEWGDGPQFRDKLNFITICNSQSGHHSSCIAEHSQYCHVQAGSASKRGLGVGSKVKVGQTIGTVGLNGWTDRPHLHFVVIKFDQYDSRNIFGFKSLKPRFT